MKDIKNSIAFHNIIYNSQRDNFNFNHKFMGWNQCFTTCAFMFMSYYTKKIKGNDDKILSLYLDDVEDTVGRPGIGEKIKQKFNWITGSTSYWWLVQKAGIEKWLWRNGVKGDAVFNDKLYFLHLYDKVRQGPVIIGTKRLGGLRTGHIILLIGHNGNDFLVHDPFGDANTNYKNKNGDSVIYSRKKLLKKAGKYVRCLYWS